MTGAGRSREQMLESAGFLALVDEEDEIVLGYAGQPWKLTGGAGAGVSSAEDWKEFAAPGYVKAVMNFRADQAVGGALLMTETRVLATDEGSQAGLRFLLARDPPRQRPDQAQLAPGRRAPRRSRLAGSVSAPSRHRHARFCRLRSARAAGGSSSPPGWGRAREPLRGGRSGIKPSPSKSSRASSRLRSSGGTIASDGERSSSGSRAPWSAPPRPCARAAPRAASGRRPRARARACSSSVVEARARPRRPPRTGPRPAPGRSLTGALSARSPGAELGLHLRELLVDLRLRRDLPRARGRARSGRR